MLSRIRIQRLGVIEDAELDLSPGLNVITGETGAGKTMVVSGLGLLLGARADSGMVRSGVGSAVVEGEVDLPAGHPALERAESAGGEVDDGLILVRAVSAEGRSRAHVGGRSAPVGVLTEIGELLVAVHGQADQWRLRRPEQHRVLLDTFGGEAVTAARTAYEQVYDEWLGAQETLATLRSARVERTREAEMLRSALGEIEAVDPQPGEEEDLLLEEERLGHADGLRRAAEEARAVLADEDGEGYTPVVDLLGTVTPGLTQSGEHDPALAELARRTAELGYLASDLASDLASYAAGVETDPQRLAAVQERRAALTGLLRRYGATTGDVLAWAQESAARLTDLDSSDERIVELTEQVARLRADLAERGAELTELRTRAAQDLGEQVTAELAHLAMGSAQVVVAVGSTDDEEGLALPGREAPVRVRRHGLDDVEIRLAANPGVAPRSVTKAASGGELSRVMLALEVVSAQGDVPTYVFDEVDAGVGGAAALDLGARLAALARHAQVIVVTHLGQVAAYADQHLVVRKSSDGQVTSTGVHAVRGEERVAEVARMLGGDSESRAALQHAAELLAEHAAQRAGD
ncbi:DNA repair protein RecN [Ornithinicoccus hortensis]|uniref:DNA repair protein RecN n=1 Tax=Ornithinicoccus hortensis TaxID=82346 RepID=A0A542YSE6_9MICO|nr:DNA repair protein RecN [Ornithinicoccus hortensis]TQL50998.1 DNA replication and repair protein RecN [Ornithinicoccus hortensis]